MNAENTDAAPGGAGTPADTGKTRVLIVKLSSLGDLFHALPTVNALKNGLRAEIDWLVEPQYADLVRCFTDVQRVLEFPRRQPGRWKDFARRLRAAQYDLVIDLQGLLKSALPTRLARAARRLGPSFHREGSHWFYHAVAGPRNRQRHAVEENMDILRHLDIPVSDPVFPVAFPRPQIQAPSPRVALIPWSRWPTKNWPERNFVETGRALHEHANASIFVMGAPWEAAACARLAGDIGGHAVNLAGHLDLPETGGWLSEMQLVITNDSGPMHMAAAAGTPVLAVFGPTDPLRTGPFGGMHTILHSRVRCRPCHQRRCRFRDIACMHAVTADSVVAAALPRLMCNNAPSARQ